MPKAERQVVQVRDGRRPPFLWCSLDAMARLREVCDGPALMSARSLYVAMAELAARSMDGEHNGFIATSVELAAFAGISDRRLKPHVDRLVEAGLVTVEERQDTVGRSLPNVYRLREPATESGGDVLSPLPPTERQGYPRHGDATASPPSRARPDGVELQEEETGGGSEEERASAPGDPGEPELSTVETEAIEELRVLIADRGGQLTARDEAGIVAAARAAPGVDPHAAAKRLLRNYGSGGRAAKRPIRDVTALFVTELAGSTPEPEQHAPRFPFRGASRRDRSGAEITPVTPAAGPRALPAGLGKPGKQLKEAWQQIRAELRKAVSDSTWSLWLDSLELAGHLTTLTTDLADDERSHRVLVITAPSDKFGWVEGRFGRLIREATTSVLGENVSADIYSQLGAVTAPAEAA